MTIPAKLWKEGGMQLPEFRIDSPPYHNSPKHSLIGGTTMKVKVTTPKGNENDVIMNPRTFSTGTKGFHGHGKIQEGDKKYQINFQMYEVGSKPTKK